jgi:hypothetical protein
VKHDWRSRHCEQLARNSAQSARAFRQWRAAGRIALGLLFTIAALQYYFLDVELTILSLPAVTVTAALQQPQ